MSETAEKAETKETPVKTKELPWWEEPDLCLSPEMKARIARTEKEAKKSK